MWSWCVGAVVWGVVEGMRRDTVTALTLHHK